MHKTSSKITKGSFARNSKPPLWLHLKTMLRWKRQRETTTFHHFESYGGNGVGWNPLNGSVHPPSPHFLFRYPLDYAENYYLRGLCSSNPSVFRGAVVLGVGLAARAGAKRVFAVDASRIADKVGDIVRAMGMPM